MTVLYRGLHSGKVRCKGIQLWHRLSDVVKKRGKAATTNAVFAKVVDRILKRTTSFNPYLLSGSELLLFLSCLVNGGMADVCQRKIPYPEEIYHYHLKAHLLW